jgi:hypothetical protein
LDPGDLGTAPIAASTPCAAGAASVDVDVGEAALPDASCAAVEPVDEEHPATITTASAAITVVLRFISVLLRVR